jgi:hypothetical protein
MVRLKATCFAGGNLQGLHQEPDMFLGRESDNFQIKPEIGLLNVIAIPLKSLGYAFRVRGGAAISFDL